MEENINPIDEYIAMQNPAHQDYLNSVATAIRTALPEAQEKISWKMPTFFDKHNIIHFAAHKNHLGIYPGPAAIEYFAEPLRDYKTSKGAIQIPYTQAPPLDLIKTIARWCYQTGNHH